MQYTKDNPFDFRTFYNGKFTARGVAYTPFGLVKRRYRIDGYAELDGEQAHLNERFTYANGNVYERQWTINYDLEGGLTGIGTDIEGLLVGTIMPDAMYMDYTFNVVRRSGQVKHIKAEHWHYPIDDVSVMHLLKFKKFGIPILRASVFFMKQE